MLSWQKRTSSKHKLDKVFVVLTQISLLGMAFLLNAPWAYFVFWVFPLISIVKALGYLRIIVEHGAPGGEVALRSLRGNAFLCNILGPYGFQYHAEHHKLPNISYDKLEAADGVEVYQGHHFSFLWNMFWRLP